MLLHHGLGSTQSWRHQIPDLVQAGYRVLAVDRWGYGESDPRSAFREGFLFEDAEEMIALLHRREIRSASLIGHSDGGSIALIMAARAPHLIRSITVAAAHIYFEPKMAEGLKMLAEQVTQDPLHAALQREHGSKAAGLTQAWLNHWIKLETFTPPLIDLLGEVTCPALVIQGEEDEHATPQHARDLAAHLLKAELWLVPGVDHMVPQRIPERFNQRVLQFLKHEDS